VIKCLGEMEQVHWDLDQELEEVWVFVAVLIALVLSKALVGDLVEAGVEDLVEVFGCAGDGE